MGCYHTTCGLLEGVLLHKLRGGAPRIAEPRGGQMRRKSPLLCNNQTDHVSTGQQATKGGDHAHSPLVPPSLTHRSYTSLHHTRHRTHTLAHRTYTHSHTAHTLAHRTHTYSHVAHTHSHHAHAQTTLATRPLTRGNGYLVFPCFLCYSCISGYSRIISTLCLATCSR